jgi:hypothetical protein
VLGWGGAIRDNKWRRDHSGEGDGHTGTGVGIEAHCCDAEEVATAGAGLGVPRSVCHATHVGSRTAASALLRQPALAPRAGLHGALFAVAGGAVPLPALNAQPDEGTGGHRPSATTGAVVQEDSACGTGGADAAAGLSVPPLQGYAISVTLAGAADVVVDLSSFAGHGEIAGGNAATKLAVPVGDPSAGLGLAGSTVSALAGLVAG